MQPNTPNRCVSAFPDGRSFCSALAHRLAHIATERAPTKTSAAHEEIKLYVDEDDARAPLDCHLTASLAEVLKTATNGSTPLVRYTQGAPKNRGQPADVLLYDQQVVNDVLFSTLLGQDASFLSFTQLDVQLPNKLSEGRMRFWRTGKRLICA